MLASFTLFLLLSFVGFTMFILYCSVCPNLFFNAFAALSETPSGAYHVNPKVT